MLRKAVNIGKYCMEKIADSYRAVALACMAVVGVVSLSNTASAEDMIPDIGIDWTALATEGTTKVGVVLIAIVGVILCIAIFRMAVRFLGNSFAGRA